MKKVTVLLAVLAAGGGVIVLTTPGTWAQESEFRELGSLKGLEPPLPDLNGIIVDNDWAIVLGKALFWDVVAGSDGQACASCHFAGGADIRVTNQVNPGSPPDFSEQANGLPQGPDLTGPNETLDADDFPFRQFADPDDRNSNINYDTDDRFSSQGTTDGPFVSTSRGRNSEEVCETEADEVFHVNGLAIRKVEPRQTPTVINAVFNFRNFWDGRANNIFNGVDPFGRRTIVNDDSAGVLVRTGGPGQGNSTVTLETVELENSSLASQAVGPPLSSFEMSCEGRTFPDLGRKLLLTRALSTQAIHAQDSVFGAPGPFGDLRDPRSGIGLHNRYTYKTLIKNAFDEKFWDSDAEFLIEPDGTVLEVRDGGYTQMEWNFAFFWGLSIQAYEATLISDDSKFDRVMEGDDQFSDDEELGLQVFTGSATDQGVTDGRCVNCHDGPEFSKAASHLQAENQEEGLVERMLMADPENGPALYDNGFYNIGVRPTDEDLGVGGVDPFGIPLSFTRQYLDILRGNNVPDPFQIDPCTFEIPFNQDLFPSEGCEVEPSGPEVDDLRVAVDGAFKVPGLRNVGLTPPYFHNGGQATLEQVVQFYNRGGDRQGPDGDDTTGTGPNGQGGQGPGSNLDPDIQFLGLTDGEQGEQDALVAFMLTLTDERVACQRAPFDHPELVVSEGHQPIDSDGDGVADQISLTIPAVGAGGLADIGKPCLANQGDLFGNTQTAFDAIVAE